MRAMILNDFGGPEKLELGETGRPDPGPEDLLVRIGASGTNPVEAKLRANGGSMGMQTPLVLGYDAAGVVEEVGSDVTDFEPGDAVFYTPHVWGNRNGTHAEYNAVPADIVAPKPTNLSDEEAAAIPLAGGTAWEAVVRRIGIRPGETILIHGGSGGVGSFAIQFAKAAGARVLATASARNQELLQDLGADVSIDYESQDAVEIALAETGGEGLDAAFDIQGPDLVARSLPAMKPFGRMACILPPEGDLTPLYRKNIALHGVMLTRERARLDEMRPLFERGQARPVLDEVLPLEEAARAHERLDTGHGRGKIVLRVANA